MYSKIVNPKTGRKVNINSSLGRNIISAYRQTLNNDNQEGGGKWADRCSKKKTQFGIDCQRIKAYCVSLNLTTSMCSSW